MKLKTKVVIDSVGKYGIEKLARSCSACTNKIHKHAQRNCHLHYTYVQLQTKFYVLVTDLWFPAKNNSCIAYTADIKNPRIVFFVKFK